MWRSPFEESCETANTMLTKICFAFPPSEKPTFPTWRLSVLKAIAAIAGASLEKIKDPEFSGCLPIKCKTPAIRLTDASGWVTEFGAVCRSLGVFMASGAGATDLYPSFQNLSTANEKAGQIDQWIDYCVHELDDGHGVPLVDQLTKR